MNPYREDRTEKRLYLGTNCHVVCLDQKSGEILWQHELRSRLSATVVTLLLHGGRIFAACNKLVACLAAADGTTLWRAEPKMLGEPVSLALDLSFPGGQLVAAGAGHIYALDGSSGSLTWHNELTGLGLHPVCLRVPGAITAQPMPRIVTEGKTTRIEPLEDEQLGE